MRASIFSLTFAALLALAPQSEAAIKACNAARISAGDCAATSETIILYAIPTAALLELADDIAEANGYPTITCRSADVAAGRCTSGQIGQAVTTPETKTAFANRMLGDELRSRIEKRRKRLAAATAEAGVTTPAAID